MVHVASHCVSLQGEGVPGLQSLVHCQPPGGLYPAIAATGVIEGLVFCLPKPRPIVMKVYRSLLTGVYAALITECYQVDPGTGGSEHS